MHALSHPFAPVVIAMAAAFLTGIALLAPRLRRILRPATAVTVPESPEPYFAEAPLPRVAPVPEIPEAQIVRTPITTARKAIGA